MSIGAVQVTAGLRLDQALGRLQAAPRLAVQVEPWSKLDLGLAWSRSYGGLRLWPVAVGAGTGLPRLDDLTGGAQVDLPGELVLQTALSWRARHGLPTWSGVRVDRDVLVARVTLQRALHQRWAAQVDYAHAWPLDVTTDALVDDGSLVAYRHSLDMSASWTLPTDPYATTLSVLAAGRADPIGLVAPAPDLGGTTNAARWELGARVGQRVVFRRMKLDFHVDVRWLDLLGPAEVTGPIPVWEQAFPSVNAAEGTRVGAGLEVGF